MSYAFSQLYKVWCDKCKRFVQTKVEVENGNTHPQTDVDCEECGTNILRAIKK